MIEEQKSQQEINWIFQVLKFSTRFRGDLSAERQGSNSVQMDLPSSKATKKISEDDEETWKIVRTIVGDHKVKEVLGKGVS